MARTYLRVRNFEKFQHYKDRNPAWIKLYAELLDNYEWCCLPDEHKSHLASLWILASKMDNKIPADAKWIANRIGATSPVDIESLLGSGFIEPWEPGPVGKREDWPSRYIPADLRAKILDRDRHHCRECGSDGPLEIGHIKPVSQGGESVEENLQTLCRSCNRRKRNQYTEDATQLRSKVLRRQSVLRSLETETEGEKSKRREEELPTEVCSEASSEPDSGPAHADAAGDSEWRQESDTDQSPTAMTFPIKAVGKGKYAGKREWPLTEAKLAEYRQAFPDLNVPALFRIILQWCIDTPAKRKTAHGMPAFLTRWCNREMAKANSPYLHRGNSDGDVHTNGRLDPFAEPIPPWTPDLQREIFGEGGDA